MTDAVSAVGQVDFIKMLSYLLLGEPLILYTNFKNSNLEKREAEGPSSDTGTLCPSIPKISSW